MLRNSEKQSKFYSKNQILNQEAAIFKTIWKFLLLHIHLPHMFPDMVKILVLSQ